MSSRPAPEDAAPADGSGAPVPPRGRPVPGWRAVARRAVPVVAAGVTFYVLAPVLAKVASAWPRLSTLSLGWAALGFAAEAGAFACTFMLKRVALHTRAVFVVVTSGLVGNAVTNIFPGADATGAAVEFRMLASGGVATGDAVGGLTATAVLQTGALLLMPVLVLPAVLAGVPISRGLAHLAYLGLGVFALYCAGTFAVFGADAPLRLAGRLLERAHNRLLRRRKAVAGLPARLLDQRNATRAALGRSWRRALLFTVGKVGLDFGCLLAMLAATRARPVPWLVLIAYASTAILALLPVTPGGLGIVEGSLTGLLVLAGIPAGAAVLATLAYRLAAYWLPTMAGPVALLTYRRRFPGGPDGPAGATPGTGEGTAAPPGPARAP